MDQGAQAPAEPSTSAAAEETPATQPSDASEASATPPETPEVKKHRVKVFDQELDVSEEDLKKDYELRRASHMRMQEASEAKKQYEQLLSKFQKDPWAAFQELQIDPDLAAEQRLLKKLERELMTPEQKALYEKEESLTARERELKEYEDAKKQYQETLAKQEEDALTYKAVKEIDTEIGEVLKATGQKPTPRVVARIAEIMLAHLDTEDGERLGADKAFGMVRDEMSSEMSEYLSALSPEQLVQTLPKSVLDALRKHDLDRVRGTNPIKQRSAGDSHHSNRQASVKKTSTDNYFDRLEKKLK
jgi:hypothetical protein